MARIELAPEIAHDFERIPVHLAQYQVDDASARAPYFQYSYVCGGRQASAA